MQEGKTYSLGEKDFSYNLGMDPIRQLIVSRVNELGENLASVSKQMGRSHSYLQQFIKRGVPAGLKERDRHKLSAILNIDQTELGAPVGGTGFKVELAPALHTQKNARIAGPIHLVVTVPVYGQAAGGRDGQFILNGNKVADILAPGSLQGVRDAYAVYVVGDSMEPRYHPGEAVFVNPRLPVRRGDYVVAQIAADEGDAPEAYVKRFITREARFLKLEQLHPRKTLQFPTQKVVSVHRIIMGGDG